MRTNTKAAKLNVTTHEGGPAQTPPTAIKALRRSILATFLGEDQFYESGVDITTRIKENAKKVATADLIALADEARNEHGLRHAPLVLLLELISRGGSEVSGAIGNTISRADEIGELLALYWAEGRKMLPNQLKKGISKAFNKFDEYQFGKYNRDGAVTLRDALFMSHAKPDTPEKAELFKKIADNTLATPDTWEVELSAGKDKKEVFTRLLKEEKLGYLALLRNLRNMEQAGVDRTLVKNAILARKGAKLVLPFRYVAAANAAPSYAQYLDEALKAAVAQGTKLEGNTIVLVDTSGSMYGPKISARSDIDRVTAAATLASVINGDDVRIVAFGSTVKEVPNYGGLATIKAITDTNLGGTRLGEAVSYVNSFNHNGGKYDRLIVITDEQSADRVPKPNFDKSYLINVSSYRNGVSYDNNWTHIDGFSEAVIRYIHAYEEL